MTPIFFYSLLLLLLLYYLIAIIQAKARTAPKDPLAHVSSRCVTDANHDETSA